MKYQIQAQVVHTGPRGWKAMVQLETFHLDGDILGILDVQMAAHLAVNLIRRINGSIEVHLTAMDEQGNIASADCEAAPQKWTSEYVEDVRQA